MTTTAPVAFPLRQGYAFSFLSLTLARGPELFNGLRGWSCTPKIDGEALVFINGQLAVARTKGRLMVEGVVTLLLDTAIDYASAHPGLLNEQFTITGSLEDGPRRHKLTLTSLRLLEFPFDLKGTEEVEVALRFTAFDFLINGVSVVDNGAAQLFNGA